MRPPPFVLYLFASALFVSPRAFASEEELPSEEVLLRPVTAAEATSKGAPGEDVEKTEGDGSPEGRGNAVGAKKSTDEEEPESASPEEGSPEEGEGSSGGKEEKKRAKNQWAGVPIIGGNSDFGWGGGALASVTRPNPKNDHSNHWSAELAAVAMFNTESFEPRFQDYYLKAVFDDVLGSGLRLTLRPSFTQVVGVNYYGLGNMATRGGSGLPDPDGEGKHYYDYTHADGTLRVFLSHDFSHQIRLSAGMIWSYVWMSVADDSRLAQDARSGSSEVRGMLTGIEDHVFGAYVYTLEFDTRDNEVEPRHGFYQTSSLTFAPGGMSPVTETWGRGYFAVRAYHALSDRVVIAGRAMLDVLLGTPPVYELSRFDNYSNAFGGEKGVRGIEAQRYYGKVKFIANIENRIKLFEFDLLGHQTLSLVQFVDFGRLWADFGASEELDGTGFGMKYSIGGGLRLLFEDSFVVALDAGWSPDAEPVGVYLTSGHAF